MTTTNKLVLTAYLLLVTSILALLLVPETELPCLPVTALIVMLLGCTSILKLTALALRKSYDTGDEVFESIYTAALESQQQGYSVTLKSTSWVLSITLLVLLAYTQFFVLFVVLFLTILLDQYTLASFKKTLKEISSDVDTK